jgi:hypothetical protein
MPYHGGKAFNAEDLQMMRKALDGVMNALALEGEHSKERAAAIIIRLARERTEPSAGSLCDEAIRILRQHG